MSKNRMLFQGYKEVVEKTSRLLELNPADLHFELGEFFRNNEICNGSLEAKKYLHILRALGWSVKKRKGVWYLNNKQIKFFEI